MFEPFEGGATYLMRDGRSYHEKGGEGTIGETATVARRSNESNYIGEEKESMKL
jgi:hypothetical protein